MGFESFRVELNDGPATADEVVEALLSWEHIMKDDDSALTPDSNCFAMNDGQHLIEMELMDSPLTLSCRFTLCHPPSVDAAFLELVRRLMGRLSMKVQVCDEVAPGQAHEFSLDQFDEFTRAVIPSIAARRSEWKAAFGNQEMAATTAEVHERIILPLCRVPIEKAG
jgi:hypothetical protein